MKGDDSPLYPTMKFQSPEAAIALHRLELLATVAAVFAAAIFVGTASTLVAIERAETAQTGVLPSEAVLWQSLGDKD
ncbi:hypothetical protein C8B47_13640 [filamentous cyanobacterium CCP4]|nr:hypothetical protein C8B47_13640 [filamentous cyanobacterium CCP4]